MTEPDTTYNEARIAEIEARRDAHYPPTGTRVHRDQHEAHQQWPEEIDDCLECEDEHKSEQCITDRQMETDIGYLLGVVKRQEVRVQELLDKNQDLWESHQRLSTTALQATAELQAALSTVKQQQEEIERAMRVLDPSMPESGLEDACRQRMQAYITESGNVETLESELARLRTENARIALEELETLLPNLHARIDREDEHDVQAVYVSFYRREDPQAGLRIHDDFSAPTLEEAMQKVREFAKGVNHE